MKKVLLIFIGIVFIKALLSIPFESPWVFGDAAIYTAKTRAIVERGNFLFDAYHYGGPKVPPLYSLALVPAYFTTDPFLNHRLILFLNAIFSSLIIFPIFFIARRFLKEGSSLLLATLVSVYPSSLGFTYTIMSENLFFPLLIFTTWFFLRSLEKRSLWNEIFLGLSLAALALTRVVGIFPIAAFLLITIFQIIFEKNRLPLFSRKLLTLFFVFFPLFWWFSIQEGFTGLESSGGYKTSEYFNAVTTILSSKQDFLKASSLALSQLSFFVVSSYFFSLPLLVFAMFRRLFRPRKQKKFLLLSVFLIINIFFFVGMSVAHQFLFSQKDPVRYLVFGRYVEPLIPLIILLGGIVFFQISKQFRLFSRFLLTAIVLLIGIFGNAVLPETDYDLVNNMALLSFRPFNLFEGGYHAFFWLAFFVLLGTIFLFPKKWLKRGFIVTVILFSLASFFPIYFREVSSSKDWAKKLDAYHWIAQNVPKGEIVGFDRDKLWEKNFIHSFWLYEFWFGREYRLKLTNFPDNNVNYFISYQNLPAEKVFSGEKLAVYRLN